MTKDLPAPLVPAEVSMSGNEWFPLYHHQLRKSRWWRSASDFARSRNVDLWCASFGEMPAGSLPDDDLELADAAGFGRDVAAFRSHKAELMAPWTLCSDGRWYHPTVCAVALDVWERTGERRRNGRSRMAAYRARIKAQTEAHAEKRPSDETPQIDAPQVTPPDVTRHTTAGDASHPPYVTRQGALQTDRQEKNTGASASRSAPGLAEPWKADGEFMAVWDGATQLMRRRAKSARVAWGEWVKVCRTTDPADILAGLRGYLREDPDVGRTGGPGLHLWLRNRGFEQYVSRGDAGAEWTAEQWAAALAMWRETGRWSDSLGPEPGEHGCKAPPAVLARCGVGVAQQPPAPPPAPVW